MVIMASPGRGRFGMGRGLHGHVDQAVAAHGTGLFAGGLYEMQIRGPLAKGSKGAFRRVADLHHVRASHDVGQHHAAANLEDRE